MRLYLVPQIGTGIPIEIPLAPVDQYWLDGIVDGTLVTSHWDPNPIRPDVPHSNAMASYPVNDRGPNDAFLVVDFEMVGPPGFAPVYDLGDPQNEADMIRVLTNPEANALAQSFGVPNSTFTGMTIREVAQWCLVNETGFAAFVAGFGEVVVF